MKKTAVFRNAKKGTENNMKLQFPCYIFAYKCPAVDGQNASLGTSLFFSVISPSSPVGTVFRPLA